MWVSKFQNAHMVDRQRAKMTKGCSSRVMLPESDTRGAPYGRLWGTAVRILGMLTDLAYMINKSIRATFNDNLTTVL